MWEKNYEKIKNWKTNVSGDLKMLQDFHELPW